MELNLKNPILFFDIESTGLNVATDRIVEICAVKIHPNGDQEIKTRRINPTIPISPEAQAVHGISDEDVKDCPTFKQIAKSLAQWMSGCDIAGYNSTKFDIPLLAEEFLRAEVPDFDFRKRKLIDVQTIFHKMEQRTLSAAYKFYCQKDLENAHSAAADTIATYEVLKAQLDRYQGVDYKDRSGHVSQPVVNDIAALSRFTANSQWADLVGHIGYDAQHREVFNFGKHKGKTVEQIFEQEPSYYDWMMKSDFPLSTKKLITQIWDRRKQKKLDELKLHFGSK